MNATDLSEYIIHFSYTGIFLWFAFFEQLTPIPEEVSLMSIGYLSAHAALNPWVSGICAICGLTVADVGIYWLSFRGSGVIKKIYAKQEAGLISRIRTRMQQHTIRTLVSMIYGATGSLDVGEVFKAIISREVKYQVLVFGLVFVVAGLAFKLGAVPFHMWLPDVYHGAPTAITLAIGAAPQLAAFAILMRILVQGLLPLAIDWQQMLIVLAVASLLVGNLAAIAQANLKRMLAFSTISQMGFLLLAMAAGVVDGGTLNAQSAYSAAMFYAITYVLTTLAVFGVILLLAREGFESEEIGDLAGLNQRSPLYAGVMALGMFSLAGIPPMVGFYAKLAVLDTLLASGQTSHLVLAVFAVLVSLIGAFYYLRVVKVMYFDAPPAHVPATIEAGNDVRVVLSLNGALVLVLGILPGGLMTLCSQSMASLVKTLGH